MIIDVRCRYTGGAAADYYRRVLKKDRLNKIDSLRVGTEEAFFKEISDAGITVAVSASGLNPGAVLAKYDLPDRTTDNDYLADIQMRNPTRFIAAAGIDVGNIFHDSVKEVERLNKTYGIKIFNIEPGRSPGCLPSDARLDAFYSEVENISGTVILQTSGLKGGQYLDYANPHHVERVSEKFKKIKIICAHGCYPFVREAIAIAMRRENIWLSPEGYLWHLGHDDWIRAINKNLEDFSYKFLFGSAFPLTPINAFVKNFLMIDWNREVLPRLLFENAITALGLEKDQNFNHL